MTAATVTKYIPVAMPSMEVVLLTFTDGDTYTSRKFHKVVAASFNLNSDNDAYVNVSNSDGTAIDGSAKAVKLNVVGASSYTGTLILFGYK